MVEAPTCVKPRRLSHHACFLRRSVRPLARKKSREKSHKVVIFHECIWAGARTGVGLGGLAPGKLKVSPRQTSLSEALPKMVQAIVYNIVVHFSLGGLH
jgi:hypothetical protein